MLGVLEMDVDQCIMSYQKLSGTVFPEKTFPGAREFNFGMGLFGMNAFSHKKLEKVIKDLVVERLGRILVPEDRVDRTSIVQTSLGFRATSNPRACKVFVCATAEKMTQVYRLRSYNVPAPSKDCTIWEACRATTAAPFLFKPIAIGENRVKFYDGALDSNNPTDLLLREAKLVWGSREIGCILSIGTGLQDSVDVFRGLKIAKTLKSKVLETEKVHSQVRGDVEENSYFRFNVNRGLNKVGLDESGQLAMIEVATYAYMEVMKKEVEDCIERLVNPLEYLTRSWPEHGEDVEMIEPKHIFVKPEEAWTKLESLCIPGRKEEAECPCYVIVHGPPGSDDKSPKVDVNSYIALQGNATVLVSTQNSKAPGTSSIELRRLEVDEATRLLKLCVRQKDSEVRMEANQELVRVLVQKDLECHPLAILQAGAFLDTPECRISEFQKWLNGPVDGPHAFLTRELEESGGPKSLWKMSQKWLDNVRRRANTHDEAEAKKASDALELLRFFAFLGSEIPERFLLNAAKKLHSSTRKFNIQTYPLNLLSAHATMSPETFKFEVLLPAFEVLAQFSFVEKFSKSTLGNEEIICRIHPFARKVILWDIAQEETRTGTSNVCWMRAVHTLSCAIAYDVDVCDESLQRLSLPHIAECVDQKDMKQMASVSGEDKNLDTIWLHFARIYQEHRKAEQAMRMQAEVLEYRQTHGGSKLGILQAKHDLASSLKSLHRHEDAFHLREEVFSSSQKLGAASDDIPPDLDRLFVSAMENLAESYYDMKYFSKALDYQETIVKLAQEDYGPIYLNSRLWKAQAKLARTLSSVGREQEALEIREEIYNRLREQEAPLSRALIISMAELANSCFLRGDILRSRTLREDVLRRMEKVHPDDPTHPDVLDAKLDLAFSLDTFRQWDSSFPLLEEVLRSRKEIFEEPHNQICRVKLKLALHYRDRKMFDQARELSLEVIKDSKLGEDRKVLRAEAEEVFTRTEFQLLTAKRIHVEDKTARVRKLYRTQVSILESYEQAPEKNFSRIWLAKNRLLDTEYYLLDKKKTAQKDREELLKEQLDSVGKASNDTLYTAIKLARGLKWMDEDDRAIETFQGLVPR
ncbi:hypothetical protein BFW01_g1758 [Lasiodiplodia theobromae]|nr:hypothetical protein BFW01_g1758 [Lasiodiplodia theobromae]